ncbi:MAG TPA: trigger factor [Candidatus Paceibacterota bacterium]|nr:trigger factor [Candidatus Paceibacterota bacterium]
MDYKKHITLEKLPNSEVKLIAEVPFKHIAPYKERALKDIKKNFELPGFRAGHVPDAMIKQHISNVAVITEAMDIFFKDEYEEIVKQLNIFPIDRPEITLTKIAEDNPICFEITVPVIPDIKLPDYKKILKDLKLEEESPTATDTEVANTIKELARGASGDKNFDMETFDVEKIDEAFIGKFGHFTSVQDFKDKIKESIEKDKERKGKEKRRLSILEAIDRQFTIELPTVFIESELDRMVRELYADIAKLNVTPKEYFERIKKTEAEVRTEWRPQAIERVRIEIVLTEISKQESIAPEESKLDHEVSHVLHHDKTLDKDRVREYVSHMMTNDAVLEYLEGLVKK